MLGTSILERNVGLDEVITGSLLTKHNTWCDDAGGTGGQPSPWKVGMETEAIKCRCRTENLDFPL